MNKEYGKPRILSQDEREKKISEYQQETVHNIAVQIGNVRDQAFIEAIRKWSAENGINELLLIDEEKLKEILRLGCVEFNKLHPGKVGVLYECMF